MKTITGRYCNMCWHLVARVEYQWYPSCLCQHSSWCPLSPAADTVCGLLYNVWMGFGQCDNDWLLRRSCKGKLLVNHVLTFMCIYLLLVLLLVVVFVVVMSYFCSFSGWESLFQTDLSVFCPLAGSLFTYLLQVSSIMLDTDQMTLFTDVGCRVCTSACRWISSQQQHRDCSRQPIWSSSEW